MNCKLCGQPIATARTGFCRNCQSVCPVTGKHCRTIAGSRGFGRTWASDDGTLARVARTTQSGISVETLGLFAGEDRIEAALAYYHELQEVRCVTRHT